MRRSNDRILTTHTGSLPRPPPLLGALGIGPEAAADDVTAGALLRASVHDVVGAQVRTGLDVVSDGEHSKPSYSTYVIDRMTGFGGHSTPIAASKEVLEFPDWGAVVTAQQVPAIPACIDDVRYEKLELLERDIENLTTAVADHGAAEGFMSAASPGVISLFLENQHYPSHEAYLAALAAAMKSEYDAIHASGLLLQIDCPDLASGRHVQFPEMSLDEWKKTIETHVEALNEATRDIPPEAMRIHLCWGNYGGPHNHDVPLSEILDIVLRARPMGISFEAANPRHEHEWRLFDEVELPDDKVLIPGVIDSTTNYVEHPELVAERIVRIARIVGRERVIAGADCGFATFAGFSQVFPSIAFAKLASLADGAKLASAELWGETARP